MGKERPSGNKSSGNKVLLGTKVWGTKVLLGTKVLQGTKVHLDTKSGEQKSIWEQKFGEQKSFLTGLISNVQKQMSRDQKSGEQRSLSQHKTYIYMVLCWVSPRCVVSVSIVSHKFLSEV